MNNKKEKRSTPLTTEIMYFHCGQFSRYTNQDVEGFSLVSLWTLKEECNVDCCMIGKGGKGVKWALSVCIPLPHPLIFL